MSKFIIVEGNSNDKDNVRVIMVKGEKGDPNSLSIGEVTETETAQATITGDAPNQTLNLGLPKATPNSLSIGEVTKGIDASASITGDAPNQTLNLVLPKGDTGEQGPAGFEVPAGSVIGWDSSSAIPEGYEESDKILSIVCTPIEPTDDKIWFQFQDNLYDKSTITTGYYLNKTTGEPTSNSSYAYTDYIDISNLSYLLVYANMFPQSPSSPGIIFYDENKDFISGIVVKSSTGYISSFPSGAKYMRYSVLAEQINTLKIIEGNPLIEGNELLDDKIFIKNKIGKYQEFIKNNYSTTELPVGTWIDGRTVYRKVFSMGALKNNGNTTIKYNIPNLDFFIQLSGTAKSNQYMLLLPASHSTSANNVNVYADYLAGDLVIQTFSDRTSYTQSYIIADYVKVES